MEFDPTCNGIRIHSVACGPQCANGDDKLTEQHRHKEQVQGYSYYGGEDVEEPVGSHGQYSQRDEQQQQTAIILSQL